jgi:uncharacterized membrane protein
MLTGRPTVIDFIYSTLNALGYHHPIHPVSTHIPMGMVIGGFLFAAVSLKWKTLDKTAYYCLVLALVNVPLAIIFGFLDWQHFYNGMANPYITAKIVLASGLAILLALYVVLHRKGTVNNNILMVLYFLSFLTVVGLGYCGGQLVFGGGT